MENYIQEVQNDQCDTYFIRHFYFKVNDSKLKNEKKLERQINKVIHRIKSKYKLANNNITLQTGTVNDDFIYDRFRLKISVNCA